MDKNLLSYALGAIALALLFVVIYQNFVTPGTGRIGGTGFVSKEEAAEHTINYIKENMTGPGVEISLKEVNEKNGIYEINFEIMGQDEVAYVTKNAKYLFVQSIDMQPPEPKEFPKAEKPEVDLFVMSFCPFGNQAEEIIMPVAELLGDKANVELHYIVSNGQEGKFSSLHGDQELYQDIRELCVQKYQGDKLWDFVKVINEQATYENVDSKWEAIAQGININVEQIRSCQEQEGNALLAEELTLTNKNYPVQDLSKLPPPLTGKEEIRPSSSPTLVINGMVYTGGRGVNDYKEGVCSAFIEPPAECEQELTESAPSSGGSCQ